MVAEDPALEAMLEAELAPEEADIAAEEAMELAIEEAMVEDAMDEPPEATAAQIWFAICCVSVRNVSQNVRIIDDESHVLRASEVEQALRMQGVALVVMLALAEPHWQELSEMPQPAPVMAVERQVRPQDGIWAVRSATD